MKYALLDRSGAVRRLDDVKVHPSAIPVEFPDLSEYDRSEYRIKQRPASQWNVQPDKVIVTYDFQERDLAQLIERFKQSEAFERAKDIAVRKVIDDLIDNLPDEDVEAVTALYPKWSGDGVDLKVDKLVRYQGVLYKVVQAHTTQADWTPPETPALFTPFRDPAAGPQLWVQPTGAQDAYQTGERVTHPNPNDGGTVWVYESTIDANTTEPGQDGTADRWWTPVEVAA